MGQIFTSEFWEAYGAFIWANAAMVIPLLLLALLTGWLAKSAFSAKEMRELNARNATTEERLKLAKEAEDISKKLDSAKVEMAKLEKLIAQGADRKLIQNTSATITWLITEAATANSHLADLMVRAGGKVHILEVKAAPQNPPSSKGET
jgi:hypothetical protein